MGHDITGYRANDAERDDEVAYLRRGAFNGLNGTLYTLLKAQDCNCGWSGCGVERTFTHEQLSAAFECVPPGDDFEPERTFLRRLVAAGCAITITFY